MAEAIIHGVYGHTLAGLAVNGFEDVVAHWQYFFW
jgi:hypothetical protein